MPNLDDWNAVYGPDVVRRECRSVRHFVVLTTPSAWRAVSPLLPTAPKGTAFVTGQEEDHLLALERDLPDAGRVLGIGGGKALDAAKFVAWKRNRPFTLIPTIVSTGALFNPAIPVRCAGRCHVVFSELAPEAVLFDTGVIRAAPPALNARGMAECICWLGAVASWEWWWRERLGGPAFDEVAAGEAVSWVRRRVADYLGDLDPDKRPGEHGIRAAAEVNRERHHLRLAALGAARLLCHIFDNTFLLAHRRDLPHGEAVALGTLMGCHLYESLFDEAKECFAACGVRFRPRNIGCTWQEVRVTLERVPENTAFLGWPQSGE